MHIYFPEIQHFTMAIMLIGAVQAFFLALLLWNKKGRTRSDQLLFCWLVCMGTHLLFYYDNFSTPPVLPVPFQILGFSLSLLSAPIMFLYIYSLTHNQQLQKKWWLHLLPYLLYNMVVLSFWLNDEIQLFVRNGFIGLSGNISAWIKYNLGYPLAISGGGYAIWSLLTLRKYQQQLPEFFSYTEKINLNWLKWLVIISMVFFVTIFSLVQFNADLRFFSSVENTFILVSGAITIYLFLVGYLGLRQTSVFTQEMVAANKVTIEKQVGKAPNETITSALPYQKSGLEATMRKEILEKLMNHMTVEQPWLDDSLSLAQLAKQIGYSSNQLSQVINQETQSNFFTFVNTYRINAVKEKLADTSLDHFTILALAFECGFRSKASFNKIFKEQTGLTPSAFRKKAKE